MAAGQAVGQRAHSLDLSVTPFEKAPLLQLLTEKAPLENTNDPGNKLTLL